MKAILLAAGFGTRLRPLTNTIPKCLVPIKGKPLLEIWIEKLSNVGIDSFLINTHYLSNQVFNFINKSAFKNKCILVNEEKLLGTAGTLLSNFNFIGNDECLLIHSDNYCLEDFTQFLIAHKERPRNCLMTMMTFQTDTPKSCGIVEVNDQNILVGFHEKVDNPPGNLANCAIYILSPEIVKDILIKHSQAVDFSRDIIPNYLGQIYTYQTFYKFFDIGTPENYSIANNE